MVDRVRERFNQLLRTGDRHGEARLDRLRPAALADVTHGLAHRAVALTVDQDLVAGLEIERTQHGIDRRGRVFHEDQVGGIGANEARQVASRIAQRIGQHVAQEMVGICLHPLAPALGGVEHLNRGGAKRAVVDEVNPRFEPKFALQRASELEHRWSLAPC